MARVRNNIVIKGFQGSLGDLVFKKRGNTYYVSLKPGKRTKPASKKQKARMERFRKAVAYAKGILADEAQRAKWEKEAEAQGRSAYHLLVSEYMKGRVG